MGGAYAPAIIMAVSLPARQGELSELSRNTMKLDI